MEFYLHPKRLRGVVLRHRKTYTIVLEYDWANQGALSIGYSFKDVVSTVQAVGLRLKSSWPVSRCYPAGSKPSVKTPGVPADNRIQPDVFSSACTYLGPLLLLVAVKSEVC